MGHSLKLDTHILESSSTSSCWRGSEEYDKNCTHSSKLTGTPVTATHPVQTGIGSHLVAHTVTASPPTLSHYGAKCESPVARGGGGDRGERTTFIQPGHFGGVVPIAHWSKDDILLFCRDAVIVDSGYMVGWPVLSSQVVLLSLVHCVPLATVCCASLLGADTCT